MTATALAPTDWIELARELGATFEENAERRDRDDTFVAEHYPVLKERGVTDFTQEPMEHFYGTDMGIRDPFGNAIRILQQGKAPARATA